MVEVPSFSSFTSIILQPTKVYRMIISVISLTDTHLYRQNDTIFIWKQDFCTTKRITDYLMAKDFKELSNLKINFIHMYFLVQI